MLTHRKAPICFSAIVALCILAGCRRDPPVASQPPPKAVATPETVNAQKTKPRTWADSQFPAGNEQTLKFLAWAKEKYELYCSMRLNEAGDCVELNIHPCWATKDDELKIVSDLTHIESLSLDAAQITDAGLRHLETMPALKELWMVEASKITDEGLSRLKRAKPGLKMDLPYRNYQNGE